MSWRKDYPLFCCLLIFNILGGIVAIVVGSVLVDFSFYPESSVQFLSAMVKDHMYDNADKEHKDIMEKVKKDEKSSYTFLLVIGVVCIVVGAIMLILGVDIMYTLHVNSHFEPGKKGSKYRSHMENEMKNIGGKTTKTTKTGKTGKGFLGEG